MNLKKLKEYNQYLIIFIIFVMAFVFGKNMDTLTPEQKQLQKETIAQRKIDEGFYSVATQQKQYLLNNFFSIKKGQCGRLFFDLKDIFSNDSSINFPLKNPNVKIYLSNNFNQTQELGTYQIMSERFAQNEKVEFCANADYSDLLFQKAEDSMESSFEISNVSFYSLSFGKRDFNNTLPSIVGNTNFRKTIFQSTISAEEATMASKFTRNNQMIGQTFVANSDAISGVDLKLEFIGVGGIGNYYLDLREVISQNGKITLSSNRMAYFCFDKDSADRDLKVHEGIYHIPLAANLEAGKSYFIGINNEGVKFNLLNTLNVYGNRIGSDQTKSITSINNKVSNQEGQLFLNIYGVDYIKIGNEKILTGTKILDNGDGTGQYLYEQRGDFSDYLDLYLATPNSNIFYDSVQEGISGRVMDESTFIYKIDTIYPFLKMKIEAQQPGGDFIDSLVYYSFDNINWNEIKSDWTKENTLLQGDKNKFQNLLQGDGQMKVVYIKVAYNKNEGKEKPVQLFGLKKLKVFAQLSLRQ